MPGPSWDMFDAGIMVGDGSLCPSWQSPVAIDFKVWQHVSRHSSESFKACHSQGGAGRWRRSQVLMAVRPFVNASS